VRNSSRPLSRQIHRPLTSTRLGTCSVPFAALCAIGVSCDAPRAAGSLQVQSAPVSSEAAAAIPTRFFRASDGSLIAKGELVNAKPVGPWRYYYRNGVMLACGKFLPSGDLDGPWLLWDSDGRFIDSQFSLRCVNDRFGFCVPGRGELDSSPSPDDLSDSLERVLPFADERWSGAGQYDAGEWTRELTEAEVLGASRACSAAGVR
jgi:hypothetical protein